MNAPRAGAAIFAIVFAIFGCIGIAVIVFLWSSRPGEFGAPPAIFRIVGTGIGVMFVVMGFGGAITLLRGGPKLRLSDMAASGGAAPGPGGYRCPHCGAALGKQEASPLGDVRCEHCRGWWNIHGRT